MQYVNISIRLADWMGLIPSETHLRSHRFEFNYSTYSKQGISSNCKKKESQKIDIH